MDNEIREYDRRQYERMRAALVTYPHSRQEMKDLVDTLLFLRDALQQADETWKALLTDNIVILEDCSLASESQAEEMGDEFQELIHDAIHQLRRLADCALGAGTERG